MCRLYRYLTLRGFVLWLTVLAVGPAVAGEPPTEPLLRIEAGVHAEVVNKAAIAHDGRLITVADDKTVRLWSAGAGLTQVLRVPIAAGSEGRLYAVAASPVKNTAVVAGETGFAWDKSAVVYAFDLAAGHLTGRLTGLPGTVQALAYSQDGRRLAVGTDQRGGGYLRILDLSAGTVVLEDDRYQGAVVATAFLPDGRLVTASADGKVRLYDAQFKLSAQYAFPAGQFPWRIAVAPPGDRLAVGTRNAAAVVILTTDGLKPAGRLGGEKGRPGDLSAVAWLGSTVLAAGTYSDGQGTKLIRRWNLADRERASEAPIAVDTVTDLVPLPDGTLAFTTAEPAVGLLNPVTLQKTTWQRAFADFRNAFEGTFAVAADGSAVDFGMQQKGRSPWRFDLIDKRLTADPPPRSDMARPRIPPGVRDWKDGLRPTVQGKPIRLDQNERARAVAASADGGAILLGADYSLQLLQPAGTAVWKIALHAPAWAVNLTTDGRFALAGLGDGTLRWYRRDTGAEVLALLALSDGRWIAWTPEGYFDHAPGAEDLVGYHVNRGRAADPEFVRSGQIHGQFFRPDLIASKIAGTDLNPQLGKTGDAKTVVSQRPPPQLKLLGWCVQGRCNEPATREAGAGSPTIQVDAAAVTLKIGIEDQGGGVGRLVLRRNVAALATRAIVLANQDRNRVEEHTVQLEPGDNEVIISAYDAQQTVETTTPIRLLIRYEAPAQNPIPVLYVLSVGVNEYRSSKISKLDNPVNDARGVAELLPQVRRGLFRDTRVTLLTGEQATLGNIRAAFGQMAAAAKPEDAVVVFLAGHGITEDGMYYFLPHDADGGADPAAPIDFDALKASALTHAGLAEMLQSISSSRKAVLIDTCHAGAFATPDVALRRSQERTWAGALAFRTGNFVLAGSSNEQEALDGAGTGHGIFTAVLLSGLKGQADQQVKGNRDGRVDVVELTRYAETRVPEEVRKVNPTHAQQAVGFFMGSDFFDLSANVPEEGGATQGGH